MLGSRLSYGVVVTGSPDETRAWGETVWVRWAKESR